MLRAFAWLDTKRHSAPRRRVDDWRPPEGGSDPAHDLRELGYDADNPWGHWANSGEGTDGPDLNGWLLTYADKAARIPEAFALVVPVNTYGGSDSTVSLGGVEQPGDLYDKSLDATAKIHLPQDGNGVSAFRIAAPAI